MPTADNLGTTNGPPQADTAAAAAGASHVDAAVSQAGPVVPGQTALAVRESSPEEGAAMDEERDTRLDRLPMQVDVLVRVNSFRVRDLLAMEKGTVVETVHEHTQDVPIRCGGALLLWSEFEVLDQRLAVRITRLG